MSGQGRLTPERSGLAAGGAAQAASKRNGRPFRKEGQNPAYRPPDAFFSPALRIKTVGMNTAPNPWPVAKPFLQRRVAGAADIDGFNHVNNARYIDWANEIAWAHSDALGLTMEDYRRLGVGCVVWRHEFDYVAPVMLGDEIDVATWIAENDNRVRLIRAYEMRNAATGKPVFRGRTTFVSIDMKSGKPARMPKDFINAYEPAERA